MPVDDTLPPFDAARPHLDPQEITCDGRPLYHEDKNTFALKPGQWTDDFSMALCLADSLLVHHYYNGADARIRWYSWWNNGCVGAALAASPMIPCLHPTRRSSMEEINWDVELPPTLVEHALPGIFDRCEVSQKIGSEFSIFELFKDTTILELLSVQTSNGREMGP